MNFLIYLAKNHGNAEASLDLRPTAGDPQQPQAYAFGAPAKIKTRDGNDTNSATAWVAVNENEKDFLIKLLDAMPTVVALPAGKNPHPIPPAVNSIPRVNVNASVDPRRVESALVSGFSAASVAYKLYSLRDGRGDGDLEPTVDLTNHSAFLWHCAVILRPRQSMLFVVRRKADNEADSAVLARAKQMGGNLSIEQLFVGAAADNQPRLPEPNFKLDVIPFARGG
jgi:hypothetical protein